jgi:hypothetical protein
MDECLVFVEIQCVVNKARWKSYKRKKDRAKLENALILAHS